MFSVCIGRSERVHYLLGMSGRPWISLIDMCAIPKLDAFCGLQMANIASLQIGKLNTDIDTMTIELKKMTDLREQEHADYLVSRNIFAKRFCMFLYVVSCG